MRTFKRLRTLVKINREKGGVKGHIKEKEVKGSKASDEEFSEFAPELNPFLVEPVLVKLLKLVDSVSQLKELRLMCHTWDEFNLKEIEERAFDGKLMAIDLFRGNHTKSEVHFAQFLEDTIAIPQLFCSFEFNFPETLIILQNRMEFFSIYPVTFVNFDILRDTLRISKSKQFIDFFTKFMKSEIWGNFKEITIDDHWSHLEQKLDVDEFDRIFISSNFVPDSGNNSKKLQKLEIKTEYPQILEMFESEFATRKYTNLTSMRIDYLPGGNLNFPGLDVSKLTRLEIEDIDFKTRPALKLSSCLINWAIIGMKLKKFSMDSYLTPGYSLSLDEFEDLRLICSNLTQFLTSQSSALECLKIEICCHLEEPQCMPEGAEIWCKIHLPTFEVLHTLNLKVRFLLIEAFTGITHTKLFGMTRNLPIHFPKLVNLTLEDENSLDALKVNSAPDDGLELKRFEIISSYANPKDWRTSFADVIDSVEELQCPDKVLSSQILPWAKSLRTLYIPKTNLYERKWECLKLSHLKNLERIVIKIDVGVWGPLHWKDWVKEIDDYLNTFKKVKKLNLKSITFIGQKVAEEVI